MELTHFKKQPQRSTNLTSVNFLHHFFSWFQLTPSTDSSRLQTAHTGDAWRKPQTHLIATALQYIIINIPAVINIR